MRDEENTRIQGYNKKDREHINMIVSCLNKKYCRKNSSVWSSEHEPNEEMKLGTIWELSEDDLEKWTSN